MGSKINTTYWGVDVSPYNDGTYTYSWGVSTNNIRALLQTNKYEPNTDSFDMSVSPWGIGYSAAGNRGQIAIQRQGSVDGNAPGVITKISFEGIDRENTNRPFYIPTRGIGGMRDNDDWIMSRVGGDCNINSDYYLIDKYNGAILAGYSTSKDCISNQYPCTFLNYQHFKLAISAFNYINLDTGTISQYSFIENGVTPENAKTKFENYNFPEHMAITTIYVSPQGYAMQVGSPTQWSILPTPGWYGLMQMRGHTIGDAYLFNRVGLSADENTKYKLFAGWNLGAYGVRDTLNTYYDLPRNYWSSSPYVRNIPVKGADYRPAPNGINYSLVQVDGLGAGADSNYSVTLVSNYCDKEQSFGDIKYKQRPLLYTQDNGFTEIKEGFALSTYSGQFRATSIYEVSGSDTFTKAQILALIKHEVAFYGFEFFIQWGDSYGGTFEVGSDDLYLPKFDEHLITTGNYTSGTASLSEPNATWGNVFDDTMPDYDSEYNPSPTPGPGGGETPWDDNPITRIQEGYWTGFGGKTYISSMDSFSSALDSVKSRLDQNLNSFWAQAKDAADAYAADLSNEGKRQQFLKGFEDLVNNNSVNNAIVSNSPNTNYTDCFLSCIRYPFDITGYFSRDGSDTGITWGRYHITLATGTWKVNGYQTGQIVQGGTLYVEKKYDNFLNYAPYTTAELYIPYCGSIPIDLEVFAGHTIDVKYLIDWFSGACLALIYRDSVVVDQIPGQIGTSVGIVAEDIQSYQNAMFNGSQTLKAQKNSLKSSIVGAMGQSMDQIGGAIGNVATAVLGGEPSSSGSQSGGGAFSKGFNIGTGVAQNYQNVKTAKYNLDHTYIDFKQLGSNGPSVGSWNEQVCRLVLYYPTFLPEYNPSEYGHTVGFACLFNKTLSEFSGLTVCSSVDTSGLTDATESEKTLIEDALKSGVYL